MRHFHLHPFRWFRPARSYPPGFVAAALMGLAVLAAAGVALLLLLTLA